MKRESLFVLLTLLCLCSVAARTDNIIITGRVVNRRADAPKSVNLNLCDWFNATTRINLPLDDDGRFRAQLNFTTGHTFSFVYRDNIYAYAAPGDSLHILIDDGRPSTDGQAVAFGGNHPETTRAFCYYGTRLSPLINRHAETFKADTLPLPRHMRLFTETYEAVKDSIARHARQQDFDARSCKLLCREALYELANLSACYQGSNLQEQQAFFTHPLFQLDDPDNLNVQLMYGAHLTWYWSTCCRQDSTLERLRKSKDRRALEYRQSELILSLPKGVRRDVILGIFHKRPKTVPLPDSSFFVLPAAWRQLKSQHLASAAIDTAYIRFDCGTDSVQYHDKEKNACQPIRTSDFFAYLQKRHPGKVLYIDVYASWCGPCREEMKTAPDLHRRYQGKDVVFVNLCLSSTLNSWQKMVDEGTVAGENYWFNDELTKHFAGLINLPGFPTYLLVDRKGHVVTRNAPRPSEAETLFRLIDRTLEEK